MAEVVPAEVFEAGLATNPISNRKPRALRPNRVPDGREYSGAVGLLQSAFDDPLRLGI